MTSEDGSLGDFLRSTYSKRLTELTAGGATVVWMTAPCLFSDDESLTASPAQLRWFNEEVIGPVVGAADRAELFDLAEILYPDGEPVRHVDGVGDLRSDGMHFSVEGSIWFAEQHGDVILELGGA